MTSAERRRELISIFEAIRSACDKEYRLDPEALVDRVEALYADQLNLPKWARDVGLRVRLEIPETEGAQS